MILQNKNDFRSFYTYPRINLRSVFPTPNLYNYLKQKSCKRWKLKNWWINPADKDVYKSTVSSAGHAVCDDRNIIWLSREAVNNNVYVLRIILKINVG